MKKTIIGIIVAIAAILIIIGLVNNHNKKTSQSVVYDQKTEKMSPIAIAVNPWIGSGLYYVAEEQGFFNKYNVDVTLTDFLDGAVGKQLLASGNVDAMASLTPETSVLLADAGIDVKVIALTDISAGADGIIADASIKTLEDLRGKKVAFESGSPSHFFLEYVLKEVGMSSKDLEVVDTPSPDAGAAFVSGSVDAAVAWEPWLSQANNRDGGKVLVNSKDVPILPGMLFAHGDALASKSVELNQVTQALFAAMEWIATHKSEAAEIMARRFSITEQDVIDQYPTFEFLDLYDNQQIFAGKHSIDVYDLISQADMIWSEMGFLEGQNTFNVQNLASDSIIKSIK